MSRNNDTEMKNAAEDPIEDMPDAAATATAAPATGAAKKKPPAKKKIADVLTEDLKQLRNNLRKGYPAGSIPTETPTPEDKVQVGKYYKELAKIGVRKLSEATGSGLKVIQSASYSKEEKVTIANAVAAIKSHAATATAEGGKKSAASSRKEVPDKDLFQHHHFFILIDPKNGLDQFYVDGRVFGHVMPKNAGDKYENSSEPVLVKLAGTHMKQLQCFKKLLGVPKKDIVQEYTGLVPKEVLYSLLKGLAKERKKKDNDADESGGDDDENEEDNEGPNTAEANATTTDDANAAKSTARGTALSGAARSDKSKILSAEDAKELLAKISSVPTHDSINDDKSPLATFQAFIQKENLLDTSFAEAIVRYFFMPKDPSPENTMKKFKIFQRYASDALAMNVEDETIKTVASLCVPGTEKPANLQKDTWDNHPLMSQVFLPVALSTAVAYHKVVQPGLLKIVEEEQSNFRHTVRERFEAFVVRTNESIKKAEEETANIRAAYEQLESKMHSIESENAKKAKNYEDTIEFLRKETDKLRAATSAPSKKRPAADQEEENGGSGNESEEDEDFEQKNKKKPTPPSAKKTAIESPTQSSKPAVSKPLPKPTPAPQLKAGAISKPTGQVSKPGAKPLPKPAAKPAAALAPEEFPDD